MTRLLFILIMLCSPASLLADNEWLSKKELTSDTVTIADTVSRTKHKSRKYKSRHQLRTPVLNALYQFVKEFSRVDTNYVEPQRYNFTVMLQNTNTYEIYHLSNKQGQEFVFSPKPSYKIGPYFGWRWIFLGYTIDLTHLSGGNNKQDLNLSLYSNQIGIDLFYRISGDDYRISKVKLGKGYNTDPMNGVAFDGFHSSIKGFNFYYIFNHRKFSYPAAYSQSTVQRKSAGSPMLGIGYTRHSLDINWARFDELMEQRLGSHYANEAVDTTVLSGEVKYTDYSVSGGYGYNWVFARNWLFNATAMGSLSYKRSSSEVTRQDTGIFKDFDFKNFSFDGVFRLAVVWNNTRWYAGLNSIFHAYNYKKSQFQTNNIFGSVNAYVGFNFGKR